MVARAYVLGVGRGSATRPQGCGWHEPLAQPDYPTLYAQYAGASSAVGQPLDDPATVAASGEILMSGSSMVLPGLGAFGIAQPAFARTLVTPTQELWGRVIVTEAGGDWDDTTSPNPSVGYITLPLRFDVYNSVGSSQAGLSVVPVALRPVPMARDWYIYANSVTSSSAGVDQHFIVGTHTFIFCMSNPTPTTLRTELWIDAAPGDAPNATVDDTKIAGDGFDTYIVAPQAPQSTGRSLALESVDVTCGTRASNPFGIL